MKKLLVIALALFTLNGVAQEKRKQKTDRKGSELRQEMTPTEIADLKSKKLTLKLDLTDAQQQKIQNVFLTQAENNDDLRKEHKAAIGEKKEKPSKDDFVKMQNHRLDQQIKVKRELKAILTPEQYEKFEKMKTRHSKKNRKHGKKRMDKKEE